MFTLDLSQNHPQFIHKKVANTVFHSDEISFDTLMKFTTLYKHVKF